MLPNFVFKNTIAHIYVALEPTSQHQSHSLFMIYTFKYEAIFGIVQVQVVKITPYTTSNFLCSRQKVPRCSKLSCMPKALSQPLHEILPKTDHEVSGGLYSYISSHKTILEFHFHIIVRIT